MIESVACWENDNYDDNRDGGHSAAYDYKHGAHKEVQKAQRRAKF